MITKILSECLLSSPSFQLLPLATSSHIINDSESDTPPDFALEKLEGWQPKSRADQLMLQRFLQRPDEPDKTNSQFLQAFSGIDSLPEEENFPSEESFSRPIDKFK